jgi:hypothetical protein
LEAYDVQKLLLATNPEATGGEMTRAEFLQRAYLWAQTTVYSNCLVVEIAGCLYDEILAEPKPKQEPVPGPVGVEWK